MKFIKLIIRKLTGAGIDEKYRVPPNQLEDDTLRLVYDANDCEWYRATILPSDLPLIDTALCQFIDYGTITKVKHEHIYNLEKLSTALSKYPHQTLVVRLNNLTDADMTPKTITRLRVLLFNKPVYLQVKQRYQIPLVDVWKRIEGILCKINDSIRMELDMEK